jgi:hypothetical protein
MARVGNTTTTRLTSPGRRCGTFVSARGVQWLGLFFFAAGYSGVASAAEYNFTLWLEELYSDNITLQSDDLAIDDWITRIRPGVTLLHEGQSLSFDIDYQYEALLYKDNEIADQDYHNLASTARYDLIGDELQLFGQAIYNQVNIDPLKPRADSNINITGNRTSGYIVQVGPEWRQALPLNSQVDSYYHFGRIDFDNPGAQSIESDRVGLSLSSAPDSGNATSYLLDYKYWNLNYEVSGSVRDQELSLRLGQEVRGGLTFYGLAGLDSDFRDIRESTLSEPRWEVGVDVRNADGYISAATGSRYWGTVYRFSAERTLKSWTYTARYSEEPATTESVYLTEIPKAGAPVPPPSDSGTNTPGTGERFIRKRADFASRWIGSKSDLDVQIFWDQRDNLPRTPTPTQGNVITVSNSDSIGALMAYNWAMGSKSSLGVTGNWTRSEYLNQITGAEDDVDYFWLAGDARYSLGTRFSFGSRLSYTKSQGSAVNFDEWRASIYLTWALVPGLSGESARSFRSR